MDDVVLSVAGRFPTVCKQNDDDDDDDDDIDDVDNHNCT